MQPEISIHMFLLPGKKHQSTLRYIFREIKKLSMCSMRKNFILRTNNLSTSFYGRIDVISLTRDNRYAFLFFFVNIIAESKARTCRRTRPYRKFFNSRIRGKKNVYGDAETPYSANVFTFREQITSVTKLPLPESCEKSSTNEPFPGSERCAWRPQR